MAAVSFFYNEREAGMTFRKDRTKDQEEKEMKNTVFTGAATAIVTPLTKDGIDFEQYGRLIDWQIAEGIDAIVTV